MIPLSETQRRNLKKLLNFIIKRNTNLENIFKEFCGEDNVEYRKFDFKTIVLKIALYSKILYNGLITDNDIEQDLCTIFSVPFVDTYSLVTLYYPEILITNEYEEHHKITDVYIRCKIDVTGRLIGDFRLYRGSCSEVECKYGYLHSHANTSYIGNGYDDDGEIEFKSCCTGRGPIKNTIASLNLSYNEDLYKLFIVELHKWLETECVTGGPYILFKKLLNFSYDVSTSLNGVVKITDMGFESTDKFLKGFMIYLLNHMEFTFNVTQNGYTLSPIFINQYLQISKHLEDFINLMTTDTNIEYINEQIDKYTIEAILINNVLFNIVKLNPILTVLPKEPPFLFNFNNKPILLNIIKDKSKNEKNDIIRVINDTTCSRIMTQILKIANLNCDGKNREKTNKKYKII